MDDVTLIRHSDLPDHCVDHMDELQNEMIKAIFPLIENQRMDVVIGALIAITSNFLVGPTKEKIEFIEKYKHLFVSCFANHIDCDIETMKIKIEQDKVKAE